jgi:hypothetical protein
MENRYHNGRIYKIVCGDLTYIGSTCQPLSKRLAQHRVNYKGWKNEKARNVSSFRLFEIGEPTIVLIETIKCENKEELFRRERHYIEIIECVNKAIPTRTTKEYYVQNANKIKEYQTANADKIKEYQKQYREQNSDNIKENQKQHREQNSDKFKENQKQYNEKNSDKIKEYQKQYREQNKIKKSYVNPEII